MLFNQQVYCFSCICSYSLQSFLFHNENHQNQQFLSSWMYLFISYIFSIYDINDNNKNVKNPSNGQFLFWVTMPVL